MEKGKRKVPECNSHWDSDKKKASLAPRKLFTFSPVSKEGCLSGNWQVILEKSVPKVEVVNSEYPHCVR